MSFSFGSSKNKSQTQESSQVNPWAPAQPLLKDVLADLGKARQGLDSSGTVRAIDGAMSTIARGNPAVDAAMTVGGDAVGTRNYVPQAQAAYRAFAGRTADTANGEDVGVGTGQYLGPDGGGPVSGLTRRLADTADRGNVDGAGNPYGNAMNSALSGLTRNLSDTAEGANIDGAGNPYGTTLQSGMSDLSRRLAGTADGSNIDNPNNRYAADLETGYGSLDKRLSGVADGSNLDLGNNTYLQKLLTQVGDEAQNRVNAQFAAAGRDLSGANNAEVGRGVTAAQLPLLLDQYTREQGRTDAAGRDLFQANATTRDRINAQRNVEQGRTDTAGRDLFDANNAVGGSLNTQRNIEQGRTDAAGRDLYQARTNVGRDLNAQRNVEQGRSDAAARDIYSADASQRGVLLDQFNRDTTRQDTAARDLFGAGTDTAKTSSGLDAARLAQRQAGVGLLNQGYDLESGDAQRLIELERLKSQVPFDQLGWLTQLLYPAAGLGSQSSGTSSTTGTKSGFQAGAKIY